MDQKSISLEAALPHETPWSAGTRAGVDELDGGDGDDWFDDDDVDAVARGLFGCEDRETPSWKGESERWIFDGV